MRKAASERYGIDAPRVVRNLALAAAACVLAAALAWGLGGAGWVTSLGANVLAAGVLCGLTAAGMLASSLWLKQGLAERLLRMRQWRGDEQVLDIGCGRGLVTIAAARHLDDRGRVTGLDLWSAEDLSHNAPEVAAANARAAGVASRVRFDTGDMRNLPYAADSFDVVTSMTAIHNLTSEADRDQALAEIWRVTRPGGQVLIFDIRHARRYRAAFAARGAAVSPLHGPILLWAVLGWRFSATKPRVT